MRLPGLTRSASSDWLQSNEIMSFYQGRGLHFISFSIFYFSCDLLGRGLTPSTSFWHTGYKVIFLVAGIRSVITHIDLEMNTLLEKTRQLQCSALSTTTRAEVLSLYREERLYDPDALSYGEGTPLHVDNALTPHDNYNRGPVFWCSMITVLLIYNTAHLAMVPLSYTSPLLFGTPMYVLYWGAMRTAQMLLD